MDRRDFMSGGGAGLVFAALSGALPGVGAVAAQSRVSARQAIRSLHLSVLLSLGLKDYDGARRNARRLVEYSNVDPNWYTYTESFEIAVILFKLTPERDEKEWLFAARGVVECFPGFTGDLIENTRVLAKATYGLLQAGIAGKTKASHSEQASLATLLLLFSAIAPGPERQMWAQAAQSGLKQYNASLVEEWGEDDGMGLRLAAVGTGLSGDWASAARFFTRIFANPASLSAGSMPKNGIARGFAAFNSGRESLEAEAATAMVMAGRMTEALVLLEKSRRYTPYHAMHPVAQGEDVLKLESQLAAGGTVLVQVVATMAGALALVSTLKAGKIQRTVSFNPEFGGIALQARTVNSGAFHFKREGLLPNYQKARKQNSAKQQASLIAYAKGAASDAHDFIGRTLRDALAKAKVAPQADVLVILPAALGFMPISISAPATGAGPLGLERQLRYADSLASAASAFRATSAYKAKPIPLNVMALAPGEGGPAYAAFERAGVEAIFARAGSIASPFAVDAKGAAQWPSSGGYWHIGSHAAWNFDRPELSGINMGRKRTATIAEVMAMKPAQAPRLVFLSACETALLNIREKMDKYLSLPTAFLAIGTGGVIASHWPVSDAASALLATRFYAEHIAGGKVPAVALSAAQRWLAQASAIELVQYVSATASEDAAARDQIGGLTALLIEMEPDSKPYSSPYYWGGFQLYGN